MKKQLLLLTALVAASSANAQFISQPVKYTNAVFTAMSPNGQYAAGTDPYTGGITTLNIDTNRKNQFSPAEGDYNAWYELGTGANSISNDGIVLCSTSYDGGASYIHNKKIKDLPVPYGTGMALSNAITPDGSRIAGSLGITLNPEAKDVMQHPVVWERISDGKYSDPVILPYPTKDISGRTPEYILIDAISADGKTLAGNIIDYSGMVVQPIIYRQGADGEWTYEAIATELINPQGLVLPEYPGEAPSAVNYMDLAEIEAYNAAVEYAQTLEQPLATDFMSEEEKAAYEAAIVAGGIVYAPNFMTDEEIAAYYAAIDQYYKDLYPQYVDYLSEEHRAQYEADYADWQKLYDAFNAVFEQMLQSAVSFEMNSLFLSQNGRYFTMAGSTTDPTTGKYCLGAYVFDLQTGQTVVKTVPGETYIVPTYITDEGVLLAAKPATMRDGNAMAYIAVSLDNELAPLHEVIKELDADLYAWMERNMVHDFLVWDEELEEDVYRSFWITGTPCCDAELKTITTWQLNKWEEFSSNYEFSYIMPMPDFKQLAAIQPSATERSLDLTLAADGTIFIHGQAQRLCVYDLSGRLLLSIENPSSVVAPRLPHSAYVIKAFGAKQTVTKKVIL